MFGAPEYSAETGVVRQPVTPRSSCVGALNGTNSC